MDRFALNYLEKWRSKANRKPLVIRGARQVGKTYLVRLFARERFDHLLEINFERHPDAASLFASMDPKTIIQMLELQFNMPVRPGRTRGKKPGGLSRGFHPSGHHPPGTPCETHGSVVKVPGYRWNARESEYLSQKQFMARM